MRKLISYSFMSATMLFALAGAMNATPLPIGAGGGILDKGSFTLNSVIQDVAVQGACIDWEVVPPTACSPTGTSTMAVSGDGSLFTAGAATIKNLNGTLPVSAFETVPGPMGTVTFDLLSVVNPNPSLYPACTSSSTTACYTGTFALTQSNAGGINQVSIQLTTTENAYLGSSSTGVTPYSGIFTTQLSGTLNTTDAAGSCVGAQATIQGILGCQQSGGTIYDTWSAAESPSSAVPEPMSFLILGSGLLGMSLFGRRRSRRS